MKYQVRGADRESGEDIRLTISADSLQQAEEKAANYGILIQDVQELPANVEGQPLGHQDATRAPAQQPVQALADQVDTRRVEMPRHPRPAEIKTTDTRSNSLGIAGLVVAIIGLLLCWIPFVAILSLPISALALLLGMIALLVSLTRSGFGIGYPIATISLSVGAIVMAMIMGIGMFKATGDALNEMNNALAKSAAEREQARSGFAPALDTESQSNANPSDAANADPDAATSTSSSAPAVAQAPAIESRPTFYTMDRPAILADGDIIIRVSDVRIEKPHLTDFLGDASRAVEEALVITLVVENHSGGRKLDFRSWTDGLASAFGNGPALKDNFGNAYRRINYGSNTIAQVDGSGSIYPGKQRTDAVVFELPVDTATELELVINARNIDSENDNSLVFRVPSVAPGAGEK
jgi:hypothetical protein